GRQHRLDHPAPNLASAGSSVGLLTNESFKEPAEEQLHPTQEVENMASSSEKARKYSRDHAERFRHELHEFLRIPSLSGDPAHAGDVKKAAEGVASPMAAMGLRSEKVMPTAGRRVGCGEWMGAGGDKPTVVIYGHYDVVPAAMEDGWDSPPFEPVEK